MSDYDPYLNLSDETPEYISVDEKIKTQPDATDLFLNDVENSISSAKKKEKKDDLNCEMEIIDEPKDVTSNIQKDTEKKFEEKTEETEIPSTKADSDTDMEESLFTPWKSLEEQYDEFLLETLDFFKADLLLDGSRSPDFPLSRMDIENRDFRYRSKLYNEFRILADKEIKKRPSTIPIIPKEVSRKTLEALDNRMLHPEFSLSAQPSVISTSIIPANHLKTPDTVQIVKKLFASTGASSSVLAHLDFRNTPTIPKAVKHPEWELMRVISGHTGWVRCLDVDTSNEWFVSGGNDRLIKVWDLASGTLKLSLTGHINTVRSVLVSDRHPYLFSCGEDQMIKCWDLECNKVIRHYHGHLSGIYCMTLHPALDILATGGRDATVRLWDMRSKLAIHVLSGHTGTVMSLVSQKNEPQIISGSLDKMIRLWDIVAGKTSVVLTHHKKAIRSLAFHPNEYTFSSAGADNTKVWRLPKGNFERNLEHVNAIINASVIRESEDGNSSIVIGGSDQGHLYFWDWKSGRLFQDMESIPQPGSLSSEQAIYALCLDKSETRLLTGECDKTIKVWRQKEPEEEN